MAISSAGRIPFQGLNGVKKDGMNVRIRFLPEARSDKLFVLPLTLQLFFFLFSLPFHLIGTPMNEFKDRRYLF